MNDVAESRKNGNVCACVCVCVCVRLGICTYIKAKTKLRGTGTAKKIRAGEEDVRSKTEEITIVGEGKG